MARIGISSPAHLDLSPNSVSVENKTPMVLYLEEEESEGTDKNTVNIGDPSVPVRREVVIGGMLIAQSQRAKVVPENPLSLHSAAVGDVSGAASGRDETGDRQGTRARHDNEGNARGDSGNKKRQGGAHPRQTGYETLCR